MQLSKPALALIIVISVAIGIAGVFFWLYQKDYFSPSRTIHEPLYPAANADGDPLLGAFASRIPCGHCYAIKFGLVLYEHAETRDPATYKMMRVFVGEGNDRTVNEGRWTKRRGVPGYPNAVVYELDANAPTEFRSYWAINDQLLLILDQYGNPRVGHEGFGYILNKIR